MRGIYIIRHLVRDPHEPFGFVLWNWLRPQKEERRDTLICEEVCIGGHLATNQAGGIARDATAKHH